MIYGPDQTNERALRMGMGQIDALTQSRDAGLMVARAMRPSSTDRTQFGVAFAVRGFDWMLC